VSVSRTHLTATSVVVTNITKEKSDRDMYLESETSQDVCCILLWTYS